VYYQLTVDVGLPAPIAVVVVVLGFGPLVGLALERIMRSFRGASPGTSLTVTIALTILLIGVAQAVYQSDGVQRTLSPLLGDRTVTIVGARVSWDDILFLVTAVVVALSLRAMLRSTRTGVAM